MSKEIRRLSVSQVGEGRYIASVILEDGQQATSTTFQSADEASKWAVTYAETSPEGADEPRSAEMTQTTASTSQVDIEALERSENSENDEQ